MNILPLKQALTSLNTNKARTLLTLLGITIGIMAVILVLSAGQAIKGLIVGELQSFGSNFIEIEVKTPQTKHTSTENAFSAIGGSIITTLKEKDAEAISAHPNISSFYTGAMGQKVVTYKNEIKKAMLFGTNASFIDIDTGEVEQGRFFSEPENTSLSQVAVLGSKIKIKLFGENDSINESVRIGNEKFKVIGTLKEKGASFGMDMDNMIFMPIKTLQKRLLGIDYVTFIFAQMIDKNQGDQTALEITEIMRTQHKITDPNKDDFAVITMDQMMEMMNKVLAGMQILLIALGSISLIVGGVGIMNIMYVSVIERTSEIGLRKALGAKQSVILWQFLFEAIIITFAGGIIGIIMGVFLSWIISIIANSLDFKWNFSISWIGLFLAVGVSGLVGLIFGLYPARQAAKKNPIEALRHE
jgi:putative ABC transport system permease protein